MFSRRKNPKLPQSPGDRLINRLLTYGLIFFIIFIFYQNPNYRNDNKTSEELDYSPISWRNYVRITNMQTGASKLYNFAENNEISLEMTEDEVDNIDVSKDKPAEVYKLSFSEHRY